MVDHGASALRNSCCNMQEVRASLLGGAEGSERCDIISIPRIEKTDKNDPFFEAEQNPNLLSGFGERLSLKTPPILGTKFKTEKVDTKSMRLSRVPPPMYQLFSRCADRWVIFRRIQFRSFSNIIILISHVSHSSNRSRYFLPRGRKHACWNADFHACCKECLLLGWTLATHR